MIDELKRDFEDAANSKITDWQKVSKLSLAKGFVENEGTPLGDAYFAAFALRYWHEIFTLYKECSLLVNRLNLTMDDIADMYIESIINVFKHRAFMDPTVYSYNKDGNEDKFINGYVYRAIDSTRERYYQYYNYAKRKANLNSDKSQDAIEYCEEHISYDSSIDVGFSVYIDGKIKELVQEGLYFEALLVYIILNKDCFISVESEKGTHNEFSEKKIFHELYSLQENELLAFCDKYNINDTDEITKFSFYSKLWIKLLYDTSMNDLKIRLKELSNDSRFTANR